MSEGRCRITILQSCDAAYAPFLETTREVNLAYASAHGYGYRHIVGNLSPVPHTANFNRYYLLRQEIASGLHEWALWMDADAIVVHHATKLESIINRTPDKMLIACSGTNKGEHDINNGIFLLNLRHPQAAEMVETVIRHCERLEPAGSTFRSDQAVMQRWLVGWRDARGKIAISQRYAGDEYNLFNYDGPFIRHVLRWHGTFAERLCELHQLAGEALYHQGNESVPNSMKSRPSETVRRRRTASPFQGEHGILVACTAAYDRSSQPASWLTESASRYGIEVTLLTQKQPHARCLRTMSLVAEYLRERPEFRYVLAVDFRRVIFCATLREMFHKYRSFGHSIVISARRGDEPSMAETSWHPLDDGSIFATAEAWIAAWETTKRRELTAGTPECACGPRTCHNDRAAWVELYRNRESDIALDAQCQLFQVLDRVDSTVGTANRDLLLEGRRIVNRETGGRPCLIHGAANMPLTAWANYVLDSPPAWNWPLIERIRRSPAADLRNPAGVERLLLELGLHDRTAGGLPDELLPYTGKGLSTFQLPNQFAPYLAWLSAQLPIRSYLEIGVDEGGSFITTVELLRRFHPLIVAIAVDPQLSPSVRDYVGRTAGASFVAGDRASPELHRLIAQEGRIGLTFIDADHSHAAVRADWQFARMCSRYVAFHDIASPLFPGVASLWAEIRATYKKTYEYVDQYALSSAWGGIGVVDLDGGIV